VQSEDGWTLDARRCISYLTIELRGPIPEELQGRMGAHVFGCDICQDVCPWNARAPFTDSFQAEQYAPSLRELAAMPPEEFTPRMRGRAMARPKYEGLMRNVEIALANLTLADADVVPVRGPLGG